VGAAGVKPSRAACRSGRRVSGRQQARFAKGTTHRVTPAGSVIAPNPWEPGRIPDVRSPKPDDDDRPAMVDAIGQHEDASVWSAPGALWESPARRMRPLPSNLFRPAANRQFSDRCVKPSGGPSAAVFYGQSLNPCAWNRETVDYLLRFFADSCRLASLVMSRKYLALIGKPWNGPFLSRLIGALGTKKGLPEKPSVRNQKSVPKVVLPEDQARP